MNRPDRLARGQGPDTARRAWLAVIFFASACSATTPGDGRPQQAPEPVTSALALLTFDSAWSRIAHTHYDTAFGGVDWVGVKEELRPRAAAATTLDELRVVISSMLARLGESHYGLIPREAAAAVEAGAAAGSAGSAAGNTPTGDVGAELRLIDRDILVWRVDATGPAAAAGVRSGWRVIAIDGEPMASRTDALARLAPQQQRTARTRLLYQVNGLLKGRAGTPVKIRLEPTSGEPVELEVVRRPQPGQVFQFGNMPPVMGQVMHERIVTAKGCVGLIRLNVWMAPLMPAIDRAVDEVRDCEGVVIDLRGNPGGMAGMVMGTAGHFLTDTLPLGFMRSRGAAELRFKANPRRARADGTRVEPYAGHLAILTDEMSASTSEFFAAGLQGVGRARIFGGSSAGQALPALLIRLPTDDVLMHVMADFTGPHGVRIEGRGVQPDVPVTETRQDLLTGRDVPLRAAIDWITGATRAGAGSTGRAASGRLRMDAEAQPRRADTHFKEGTLS